ncbi:MAG: hypothetical protein ACU85U_16595 [Gammaproteobacteria bacterium]|jgi:hypothetical protein
MSTILSLIESLRAGVDLGSVNVEIQVLYEQWLKQDSWAARNEALPLVVGVDPVLWQAYIEAGDLAAAEQALWAAYQREAGVAGESDRVAVDSVVSFFRKQNVKMPTSFSRLYDFIRQTTLSAEPAAADVTETGNRGEETEAVLGAALALVASMPDRCRDEHGFVAGERVAKLILQSAVRWFPMQPPAMTEGEMAALIDKWLD